MSGNISTLWQGFSVNTKIVVAVLLAIVLVAGSYVTYKTFRPDVKFNVTPERMVLDLEGRSATVAYGQVWPFDPTQGLKATVIARKQVDDFVVVAVNLSGSAKVIPTEKDKDKKLPERVSLSGVAKLTYESIGGEWWLVSVDGLTLKATPSEQ